MKKIISISIILLMVSVVSVVPNVCANEPNTDYKQQLRDNLIKYNIPNELIDPATAWACMIIDFMILLFGETLGLTIGMFTACIVLFIPFALSSLFGGVIGSVQVIFSILEEILGADLEEVIERIGIVGITLLMILIFPITLTACIVLYPCMVVYEFISNYDYFFQCIRDIYDI